MGDADKSLKISIDLAASGTDQAEQAKRDLADVREGTKGNTDATEHLSAAGKEGASVAELLHEKHRAIHSILTAVAHEAGPGAAAALAALGAASGGGFMMGVEAAREFLGLLQDIKKETDEIKARSREAFVDMQTAMHDAGDKVHTLSTDLNDFWDGLARKTAANAVKQQFDQMLGQIKNIATAAEESGLASKEKGADFVEQETARRKATRAAGLESAAAALSEQLKQIQAGETGEGAKADEEEQINIKRDIEALKNAFEKGTSFKPVSQALTWATFGGSEANKPTFQRGLGTSNTESDIDQQAKEQRFLNVLESAGKKFSDSSEATAKHVKLLEDTITRMTEEAATLRGDVAGAGQKDATSRFTTGKSIADTLQRGGSVDAAQAQYLILLEEAITGHKLTLDRAVWLIEAQSANANFTLTLLSNAYTKIEAVHKRLEQLEAQHGNGRNVQGGQG